MRVEQSVRYLVFRLLEGYEKVLGKEHPDTLTSVYCLAYLYINTSATKQRSSCMRERAMAAKEH